MKSRIALVDSLIFGVVLLSTLLLSPLVISAEESAPLENPLVFKLSMDDPVEKLLLKDLFDAVRLEQGSPDMLSIELSGAELNEHASVVREKGVISITGKGANAVTLQSSGNTINIRTGGSNSKQRIIVNGEVISAGTSAASPPPMPVELVIRVPANMALSLESVREISCSAQLGDVSIKADGSYKIALGRLLNLDLEGTGVGTVTVQLLKEAKANLSGVGKLTLDKIEGGNLDVALRGSSKLKAHGDIADATLNLSDASRAETSGAIAGELRVTAAGASKFQHTGTVKGEVHKDRKGAAKIEIAGQ